MKTYKWFIINKYHKIVHEFYSEHEKDGELYTREITKLAKEFGNYVANYYSYVRVVSGHPWDKLQNPNGLVVHDIQDFTLTKNVLLFICEEDYNKMFNNYGDRDPVTARLMYYDIPRYRNSEYCPRSNCGQKGIFKQMAMCCPAHGPFHRS